MSLLGSLVKTTAVDYPGRIAASFFVAGCNLRCPYCYNKALAVKGIEELSTEDGNLETEEDLFKYLEKRRGVIGAITVSGGEPLIHKELPRLLRRLKSMGLLVKLDTNGILCDALEKVVNDKDTHPDFIAMDIKTSPDRYKELSYGHFTTAEHSYTMDSIEKSVPRYTPQAVHSGNASHIQTLHFQSGSTADDRKKENSKKGVLYAVNYKPYNDKEYTYTDYEKRLQRSIEIISDYPANCREWRTVLVPGLVGVDEIDKMAKLLPLDASWQFAAFRPGGCIDEKYNHIEPMSEETTQMLLHHAQCLISGAQLR